MQMIIELCFYWAYVRKCSRIRLSVFGKFSGKKIRYHSLATSDVFLYACGDVLEIGTGTR